MRTFLTITAAVFGLIVTDIAQAGNPSRRGRPSARNRIVNQGSAPATGVSSSRETVSIRINDVDGVIPPLQNGDREFGQRSLLGPLVTVKVQYFVQGNSIFRRIYMKAVEKKLPGNPIGDISTAAGWSPKRRVYTAPAGKQIFAILDGLGEVQTLVANQRTVTGTVMPGGGDLGDLKVYGAHDGPDIGHYTKAVLRSDHPMRIVLAHGTSRRVKVTLPRTLTYRPPHTNGDKEFDGNGPRIWIRAQIFKAGSNRVTFSLYMKAEETKGDRTTVEGRRTTTIYTVPNGYRIKRILGKTAFNLLDVVDKNHSAQTYVTEIGGLQVFGDHKGKDAEVYTRVIFVGDYSVEVELEPIP